jgi:hypothetical protein
VLHIECLGCHKSAYLECEMVPVADGRMSCGRADCAHLDPDAAFDAAADCSCCTAGHHHGLNANSCAGGHDPCPSPGDCPVWLGMQPHRENSPLRDTSAGSCPGGHCGPGVPGCGVCRPLKITVMPGSVTVRPAGGVG